MFVRIRKTRTREAKWIAGGIAALFLVGGILVWQALPTHAAGSFIGYWKFDESVAGDPAVDQSGNGNTLTPINAPAPSTDRPAQLNTHFADPRSISLNGSNQYFLISDNASLNSATSGVSLAIWVKFNNVNGSYQSIISKWRIGFQQQWTLQLNANGKVGWWTGNGGTGADNLESVSTMASGTWYHIVATSQGLNKKLYINGVLEGSKTSSVAMGVASGIGVGIGAKTVGSAEYLNGLVDDIRFYSYPLSDGEASQLADGMDVPPDTTAPTPPGTPTATSPTLDTTPTVSWTASSDSGSGLVSPAYTLEWSTSATFTSVVGSATTNGLSLVPSAGLTDGNWYFRVKATDIAGNVATSDISDAVLIDTTGPTTPGMPGTPSPSNDNTPTWDWSASTDSGTGLAFIAYAVQWSQDTSFFGLGGQAGVTENTYTIPDGLNMTDGTWYFRAKAIDVLGNESGWSDYGTVQIDTVLPVISDVAIETNGPASQRTITWTTDKDTSSKVSYGLTASYGTSTTETDISPHVKSHTVTLNGLAACSTYHFIVTSEDASGNVTSSEDRNFVTTGCAEPVSGSTPTATGNRSDISQASDPVDVPTQTITDGVKSDQTDEVKAIPESKDSGDAPSVTGIVWWLVAPLILVIVAFLWWLVAARRRAKDR